MNKYFDWKGNEINEGMIIYFVSTRNHLLLTSRWGFLIPSTGEMWQEPEENWIKRRDEEVWELGEPYEVKRRNDGGFNVICEMEGYTIATPIEWSANEKTIIAIKGISDIK